MHKLTRISFNSGGWRRPTGDARNTEIADTYNRRYGFGHEDWLFRDEWQIDGWRYAFIEGVNKSHRRLVQTGQPFDLTLFTIEPTRARRYIAHIRAVECLSDQQANDALAAFKDCGWYARMVEEIKSAGGDTAAFGNTKWAKHILNVRFRLENLTRFTPGELMQPNDPATRLSRYLLYDAPPTTLKQPTTGQRRRQGSEEPPSTSSFTRRGTSGTTCEPEHARMQAKLYADLRTEFPAATIKYEQDFIDLTVETPTELLLFEIKSDLDPRVVIRQALGQLLEYAFYSTPTRPVPVRLVIVGRRPLTPNDTQYLQHLQNAFSLPIDYRAVPL